MSTSDKLTYLATTKDKLKTAINYTGANITNDTFRSYPEKLYNAYIDILNKGTQELFNSLPKVQGTGTSITLNNTKEAPMQLDLKGNTKQDGKPTPTTPPEIHNVSGDNEIKVQNKNLFDKNSVVGGFVNADGSIGGDTNAYRTSDFIPIQPNTTYYKTRTESPRTKYYNINKQPLNTTTYQDISIGGNAGTFTTPNNVSYLRFSYPIASVDDSTIQIEKDNQATDYVEHQEYTKEINLPVDNLFDGELELGSYWGVDGTKMSANDNYRNVNYIKVSPNTTYTFSINGVSQKYVLLTYKEDKTFIQEIASYTTGTFTTGNNVGYINFRCFANDFTSDYSNLKVQLEKGSKANSYTPYGTTPIELCKIGDYQDEFFKNAIDSEYYDSTLLQDKWYLKKRIGKVVLDGTENWSYISVTQGSLFRSNNAITDEIKNDTYSPLCNYYIGISYQNYQSRVNNNIYINSTNNFVDVIDNRYTSESDFKTWLGTHNTIVYYVLATPKNILLNDTLQETLDSFYSMQGQTNISQTNNDLPFKIEGSAIKEYE